MHNPTQFISVVFGMSLSSLSIFSCRNTFALMRTCIRRFCYTRLVHDNMHWFYFLTVHSTHCNGLSFGSTFLYRFNILWPIVASTPVTAKLHQPLIVFRTLGWIDVCWIDRRMNRLCWIDRWWNDLKSLKSLSMCDYIRCAQNAVGYLLWQNVSQNWYTDNSQCHRHLLTTLLFYLCLSW